MLKLFDFVAPWMLHFLRYSHCCVVQLLLTGTNYFRQEMRLNQSICNSTFGEMAAKYYLDNRYGSDQECSNPCRVMSVTTINKFKAIRNGTMEIKILLPRIVNVTKDVFVKTFISLGYRNQDHQKCILIT